MVSIWPKKYLDREGYESAKTEISINFGLDVKSVRYSTVPIDFSETKIASVAPLIAIELHRSNKYLTSAILIDSKIKNEIVGYSKILRIVVRKDSERSVADSVVKTLTKLKEICDQNRFRQEIADIHEPQPTSAKEQAALALAYDIATDLPRNITLAAFWHERAANQGYEFSQLRIAYKYMRGEGVSKNLDRARNWYEAAMTQHKSPMAFYFLGEMYEKGMGIEADSVKASTLFRVASEAGFEAAQEALAEKLQHGKGVQKDLIEAAKWYQEAANQGSSTAKISLAKMYENGDGVRQDQMRAFQLFHETAKEGIVESIFSIAERYRMGIGCRKNLKFAYTFYLIAREQGFEKIPSNYDSYFDSIQLEQRNASSQFAKSWEVNSLLPDEL
jgi:TPR repeat protein